MSHIAKAKAQSLDAELHWLVNSIIAPEFPQLIEALHICSNLLLYNSPVHPSESDDFKRRPSITLPVSSGPSDHLKGIIVRDGAYITKMSVSFKERHFTRMIHKLQLVKPFLLPQIITAKQSIDNSVELILQAISVFDEIENNRCNYSCTHEVLISVFDKLLKELQTAKNSLQFPTQPELVFPMHRAKASFFDPELPSHIALDLYVSSAELCIDLKDLARVDEKPWCEIDKETGKSYVDEVRDQMSTGKTEGQLLDNRLRSEKNGRGLFGSVISHLSLKGTYESHDYITRCVTYDNSVVMVKKKIDVTTADPVLVSAFTKLDSVEYMVSSFLVNIRTLHKE